MSLLNAALVCSVVVSLSTAFPGIWRRHHPDVDPRYKEWAHFAISSQVEGRTNYDTLLKLLSVESQVIAGVDYKLKMMVAESTCVVGKDWYSRTRCHPKVDAVSIQQPSTPVFVASEAASELEGFTCAKEALFPRCFLVWCL
uniref:Putative cystatin n=1 Tax=Ixodes scapularis TaxID=6945 RepID=A0A4D5RGK5_IXOSC